MLSPLPRRSGWAYSSLCFTQPYQPSPKGLSGRPARLSFSRIAQRSLALRPAHSRCHQFVTQSVPLVPGSPSSNVTRLSVKDAEALALKNNPAISVARLNALASRQVTREASSNLWPQAYGNLTAVDARANSRITAGALNNPSVYTRAAGGATVTQLITDFGHTTNLVASARLQARADEQSAAATKQDVLLAVDQAFYSSLQTHAVLQVAEQTVASRQLLSRPRFPL